ncbi:AAA family ATPase [Algoriphagus namhaensis]
MEYLIQKSARKSALIRSKKQRYLFDQIDWEQRLILLLGYRGAGKTTILLQQAHASSSQGIYMSLDDFYFETHRLAETVAELYALGYRLFLLDDVGGPYKTTEQIRGFPNAYLALVIPGGQGKRVPLWLFGMLY